MKIPKLVIKIIPIFLGITLAATLPAQARQVKQNWVYPTDTKQITNPYNPPLQNWLPGHRGIDFFATTGDEVYAVGDGTVTYAGEIAGKGVVVISHGKVRTTYEPVIASVKVGQQVKAGQLIGTLFPGVSHCATVDEVICLHLGALLGEKYINPMLLINPRVRLLPLD